MNKPWKKRSYERRKASFKAEAKKQLQAKEMIKNGNNELYIDKNGTVKPSVSANPYWKRQANKSVRRHGGIVSGGEYKKVFDYAYEIS